MENEKDLVVFENDEGDQITMEVLDYLFYEGKEYAVLTEYAENNACDNCESNECEGCDDRKEAIIMEVVSLDDDMEEFVPVEEELAVKLIELIENGEFEDVEFEDEDE